MQNGGWNPTFFEKCLSGVSAGGIAAFIAAPADRILVRVQAD